MKANLTYGSSFEMDIQTTYGTYKYEMPKCSLQDAVDYAEMVFNGETPILDYTVEHIIIYDATTNEICAECDPDSAELAIDDINYNSDELMNRITDF